MILKILLRKGVGEVMDIHDGSPIMECSMLGMLRGGMVCRACMLYIELSQDRCRVHPCFPLDSPRLEGGRGGPGRTGVRGVWGLRFGFIRVCSGFVKMLGVRRT